MVLELSNVSTGYRGRQVLFGVSVSVASGDVVALVGPNGSGKSTLLRAACGALRLWEGRVSLHGRDISRHTPAQNVGHGLVLVPQGSRVFRDLTVLDNLRVGAAAVAPGDLRSRIDDVLRLFPALSDRMGDDAASLSGGEQQMLAIGRALMTRPKLLMLDEPSLGLAPNLVDALFELLLRIRAEMGTSILIAEQKVRKVLGVSDRVYVLRLGRCVFGGSSPELLESPRRLQELFL